MTVNRIPYTPPVFKHACEICDKAPAIFYRPAQAYCCGACILDYQAIYMPRKQEP
jgi:hypothetical protein